MLMKMLNILLLLFLFSCAHNKQVLLPKVSEKNRVSTEDKLNSGMPNYYLVEYQFSKNLRAPASTDDNGLNYLSDKKIYFFSLYTQSLWFGTLLNKKIDLQTCPQFHHEMVVYKDLIDEILVSYEQTTLRPYSSSIIKEESIALYPELILPYSSTQTVYEAAYYENSNDNVNEIMLAGFENQLNQNIQEINTLCEEGASDNYFIFQNLITHYASKEDFHYSQEALKAYLKVPVFSNMMLFQSMTGDRLIYKNVLSHLNISSYNHFEEQTLQRTNAWWIKQYFEAVRNQRNGRIQIGKR